MTALPLRMPTRPDDAGSDVVSDVLSAVRLTGSMFFLVEASAPWVTAAPRAEAFAAAVLPRVQQLVSYHVMTEGRCWGGLEGEVPQPMEAGDILVVPHGDPYFLAASPDASERLGTDEAVRWFRQMAAGALPPVVRYGGSDTERAGFICGFLGCDTRPFNPVLAALPRVIHLRGATRPGHRLAHLVEFALAELKQSRPGEREVLLRLSELMFIEVVRCHLECPSGDGHGRDWMAGLRDPIVGRVLARLHADPARAWTLDALAADAATSRSVLAERFTHCTGLPPMHYLAAWRMQLAAQLLDEPSAKVRAIAEATGYDSEAAFSRAFKKHAGMSPSAWRQRARWG